MHHGYEAEIDDEMRKAFREVTGQEGAIKAEDREKREPVIVPNDLDEIFDELNRFKGYNDRLDAWFSWRDNKSPVYEARDSIRVVS
jgi:hypothetical protein